MNPFAAAASGDPQQNRRDADLRRAIPAFIARHTDASTVALYTPEARMGLEAFWCDVTELAVACADGSLDLEAERLLAALRDSHLRQHSCGDAHAAFFRSLLRHADQLLEPFFDVFWSTGGAFTLPHDDRTIDAALEPLGTIVHSTYNGDGKRAREAMAKHLRQLPFGFVL